jgi:hypothetical protein
LLTELGRIAERLLNFATIDSPGGAAAPRR